MYAVETRALHKDFAGFRAVDGVELRLEAGRVHAMVGPNGAGKTSLFNLLTGFLRPTSGQVLIFGDDVTGERPDEIAKRGVARSFQITSLFEELSVVEHVALALQARTGLGYGFWRDEAVLRRFDARARELLEEVGLAGVAEQPVRHLPYGQKRALELALALALQPKLLLLDEPTAGMSAEDVERTIELIVRVRVGRTVVLVEHNMGVVGQLADNVIVLQQGKVIADGPYERVRADPAVVAAYLGAADA
ncbi:MAG: ATP-binding cassette domain-containing protein [Chloroflexota bacterium]|nr:ATP-binding cassette domain-containing protein [Chloroflexota bacterium]